VPDAPSLKPLHGWRMLSQGRFETRHDGHRWTVDVDFLDPEGALRLYRDSIPFATQKSPASFELGPATTIEAAKGLLGMHRVDLVAGGRSSRLEPVDGTLEARRLRLERERPRLSGAIGAISWTVLVVALVTGIAEVVALLTPVEPPFVIRGTVGFVLGIAALTAALERALRFKCNRWLD
jgi:hypothetical protein